MTNIWVIETSKDTLYTLRSDSITTYFMRETCPTQVSKTNDQKRVV